MQIETSRTVELLSRYAQAKFGEDWTPADACSHVGPAKGRELGRLFGDAIPEDHDRAVLLINEYGSAKFGEEWFPGSARVWLGHDDGAELEERLGYEAVPLAYSGRGWSR